MKKDTSDLLEELKSCEDFRDFREDNRAEMAAKPIAEYLNGLIEEKDLKKSDIVRDAEMSEVYAYQILSGIRKPDRRKLLCLAFGMALSFDEVQKMLKATGYAPLYAKNPYDCILIYAFCKHFTIVEANELLYRYGEEMLG